MNARATRLRGLVFAATLLTAAFRADAQEPTTTGGSLRVFLDCDFCDFDYIRRTIEFVDWVRDRNDAQVHVLVTRQSTGAGGDEFSLFFIGRGELVSRSDTLRVATPQDVTEDEERQLVGRELALGVLPFAIHVDAAQGINVTYDADEAASRAQPERDPWDFWVFRTRLGSELEGESREKIVSLDGSVSANRVTDALKIEFSAYGSFEEEEFELEEDSTFVSTSRFWDVEGLVVLSIGPHWSAGLEASATSSTRVNQDLAVRVAPALEYSFYPYVESSRRQIAALYTIGPVHYDYDEITLFERTQETRVEQRLELAAGFQQPWGEIDASVEWSNYMHDFGHHRIDLFGGVEVRLFRGFSLDLRGNVARIKDQIYIPLEDISREEIFLRRRQLGTDFEYELNVGFSFTFGSVYNNVVNPRLRRNQNDGEF
jgi:hypothetical protein